ncbi:MULTISPECIES: thioredoxin family protein [unclassified Gilliamella]|uniref:thioredoxin family protein n=1 Tax=unclassified Gilliamella TaxID=2685620 RepID=UPI00226A39C2|nr:MULTISPECIES: co-chaperone YbbN [unclassified Gilliamella]MCX8574828.1 co-chaperone YbbN [Gilliamella sp. B3831]MCX8577184.1 co-chaperone YbbN [Gilliamella sp. B3815]MCX8587215.1 co-chaperone YbbN [Gilliamella sp. B3801]MCX8589554.1 co-chaperone YbbN [Gilliamella sp. B3812]MCX8592030.1 co-chaperone YbbN [Gilliamella sp. B3804]
MQNPFIFDVNEQNIQEILEKSTKQLVLFYFWSPRSPNYEEMTQTLTKLADEYHGQFILASVNCDEQQMLAAQFGLRAIPTVYLFQNGQPLDGFQGPQPEEKIRELLTKVLPNEDELKLIEAQNLFNEEKYEEALPLLRQAWKNLKDHLGKPRSDIAFMLAKAQIALKQLAEAKDVLASVPLQDQDTTYHGLQAEIELLEQAANSPELQLLQAELEKHPDNVELMIQLSSQLMQVGRQEEALELLFKPLTQDLNAGDGQVKKTLLDLLAALGTSNPLAASYRRKLYTLLY